MSLRVLVVDDTVLYRKIVSDVISELPDIEVIGTASNGKIAMERIISMRPDLVTLDMEMPEMGGLDVLRAMKERSLETGAIVLSALTRKGGDLTLRALELGAFDFITKPSADSMDENKAAIKDALAPLLKAYANRMEIRSILRSALKTAEPAVKQIEQITCSSTAQSSLGETNKTVSCSRADMVVIGISTGGPNALATVLPKLPADLGVPVLIVQHMPPLFTQSLAESLDAKCAIRVKEAENDEVIKKNIAYIAPGGKQMKLIPKPDGTRIIRITDDPPENNCKPSVDYLFRSVAHGFPGCATAVIMTGMGSDGTLGLRLMKRNKCFVIAQDEASCVVFGMPKEAINAGVVDIVVPLDRIADSIYKTINRYN